MSDGAALAVGIISGVVIGAGGLVIWVAWYLNRNNPM